MYVAARLFINISFGAFESASKVGGNNVGQPFCFVWLFLVFYVTQLVCS